MLINKANLQEIYRNLNASFQQAFDAAPTQWPKIAMLIESTSSKNDYSWVQYFPKMREWIGEKVIKALAGENYIIPNKDWEATIEVDRNDIQDDQLGIYRPQAQMAGYSAAQLPDEIVFALLNNGFAQKCYDGKNFFATNHPVGGKNVSNKLTKVLDISTFAKARASYGAARVALLNMKDDDPNPYKGTAEVVTDSRITSATAWFLLDTTKPMKPLIYQERTKPNFVEQTDMSGGAVPDSVFMQKKYRYSVECRAAGGYGFWQLAVGSTGAG